MCGRDVSLAAALPGACAVVCFCQNPRPPSDKKQQQKNRLNGAKLRTAFTGVKAAGLYPTIGLHSKGEAVEVNFGGGGGGSKPFKYDLDAALAEEREARAAAVARCGGGVV